MNTMGLSYIKNTECGTRMQRLVHHQDGHCRGPSAWCVKFVFVLIHLLPDTDIKERVANTKHGSCIGWGNVFRVTMN